MQNKTFDILALISASYVSGAERVSYDVLRGFKEHGLKVLTLTNGWNNGEFSKMLQKEAIPERSIKLGWYYLTKPLWTLDSLWNAPKAFNTYRKILKQNPKATIYTSSFQQVFLLRPWLKNRKLIVHIHDSFSGNKRQSWFLQKIAPYVTSFIAISQFIKEDLIKCGIEEFKIKVVYNGIDLVENTNQRSPTTLYRFGIVGQLIPRKGHGLLLEAVAILKKKISSSSFSISIIGKGSDAYVEGLKNRINELGITNEVIWEGYKPTKESIYADLDAIVAPSEVEPFGLITVEANSFGLPVIAPDHSGFKETIQSGFNGVLVEPGNPEALAIAMHQFVSDRTGAAQMGFNGKRYVYQKFSKQMMIDEIISML